MSAEEKDSDSSILAFKNLPAKVLNFKTKLQSNVFVIYCTP
jgi:hypothetical protein